VACGHACRAKGARCVHGQQQRLDTEEGMTTLRWLALGALLLASVAHAQTSAAGPGRQVKLDKHKLSYAIGYQIGSQFAGGDPDVDLSTVQAAMRDAYARQHPAVSMQDMHDQLQGLEERMHAAAVAEFERIAATNARKSADYLARNAKQPGVVQLPSGIQYRVLKKGNGSASPDVQSIVTVNYRGMLVDGTEFDSSWAHGAPVSFQVNRVIRGWQDVIPRMHVGDRWNVVIPSQLAYGERGQLPRIGPNEALVFEIELLAVKP
jgi:FKBP-type peptidyl-prolyl cis-trans isomerase FklB